MKQKILLATLLTIPAIAMAGVNPQNGNFFITYQDITQQSGDHDLNLTRTYNSQATELGWFGSGWGSPFETRLIAMPDGSVAVQENGTGQINFYRAKDKADIQKAVMRIVEAANQRDKLSPEATDALRKKLADDEELRVRKVLQYGLHADLPANTVLRSNDCPAAELVRLADSYKRVTCDKSNDYFDLQGRLIRREESNGYSVRVSYEGQRPASNKDSLGQSLDFKWTPAGLLTDASNSKDHTIYTQDKNNDLVKSNDVNGNSYNYDYDNNHNLTRIGYVDDTSMRIEYTSSANGIVQSVTQRFGDKMVYEYRSDPSDARHTWTKITAIAASGEQSSRELEYQGRTTETGAAQLARLAVSNDRGRLETIYDDKGRVIRKANNAGGVTQYVYHPQSDKLIMVWNNDLKTEFHYDKQGNLIRAEDSNGRVIDLDYRDTPQIQRMVDVNRADKTRRELTFKYNAAGKPTEIALVGTGKITVDYDDKGEISKVNSSQGAKMALQVTQAFQNLLSVVKVAGARIDM
jgi:YD repeat-containing protein